MLNLCLRPSTYVAMWIIGSHLLAFGIVWVSALPWYWCVLADTLVGLSFWALWRSHCAVGIRYLSCREGQWVLAEDGQEALLQLHGEYYVSPWLIILVFQGDPVTGSKRILLITPDSIEADELRHLRVFLKNIPQPIAE